VARGDRVEEGAVCIDAEAETASRKRRPTIRWSSVGGHWYVILHIAAVVTSTMSFYIYLDSFAVRTQIWMSFVNWFSLLVLFFNIFFIISMCLPKLAIHQLFSIMDSVSCHIMFVVNQYSDN